jgi:NAD(P)H-quinone oxidoreductase subunit 5
VTDLTATPLALLAPVALAAGALVARLRPARAWRVGLGVTIAAPVLALLAFPALTPVSRVMLLLVAGIGAVTLRFSQRYLDGERDTAAFVHWFLLTLTGASLVVTTQDLVVLALGWTLTSLSLHQLLTFGAPRAAAEVAAHKKFLLSRLADVSMLVAVVLLARAYGSTDIVRILDQARDGVAPAGATLGALFLALTVILRSAQLPFHGWLIQVMEAPTPVSALLHAGVVNLGAYVLIALAPLMLLAPTALIVLLAFGLLSATLAALTSLAQPSIKGALAWSTCAQMGFVLVEIGVGAFDLALLHIAGHAAYKAHAFLSSGSTVSQAAQRGGANLRPTLLRWAISFPLAAGFIWMLAPLGRDVMTQPAALFGSVLLVLAITPALATAPLGRGLRALWPTAAIVAGLPLLYAMWHAMLSPLTAVVPPGAIVAWAPWLAGAALTALLATYALVTSNAQGALAKALYPHAIAGFHLDALFTRLTFRVWPPSITPRALRVAPERAYLRLERAA